MTYNFNFFNCIIFSDSPYNKCLLYNTTEYFRNWNANAFLGGIYRKIYFPIENRKDFKKFMCSSQQVKNMKWPKMAYTTFLHIICGSPHNSWKNDFISKYLRSISYLRSRKLPPASKHGKGRFQCIKELWHDFNLKQRVRGHFSKARLILFNLVFTPAI